MESQGGTSTEEHLLIPESELTAALARLSRHRVPGESITSGPADLFNLVPLSGLPPNGRESDV